MSVLARLRASAGRRRVRALFELVFLLSTLLALLPLFSTRYLPIQDLPQHVAAVRVIADYGAPKLNFERYFELALGSTQYLSVYLVSAVLAKIFGAVLAVKLVIASAMGALPYALRALLRQLRKPQSYALLSLPLAYNAHLVLGFLNFLAALPLLVWGIALCLRSRERFQRKVFIGLLLLALGCFYTHVVPYGLLVLAALLLLVRSGRRSELLPLLALAPSMIAALFWMFQNPAGRAVAAFAVGGRMDGEAPQFRSTAQELRDLPEWFIDVFQTQNDDRVFAVWLLLASALFIVGATYVGPVDARLAASRARFAWLVPIAFFGYWVLPSAYGFMWPINGRFPLLALLLAIPAAPRIPPGWRFALAGGAVLLTCSISGIAWQAFRGAGDAEYRGLEQIIARIPEGSRVAGLIYRRSSRFVRFAPYLHAVAWIQAERGGAVEFSFAEFPHSPFRFREDNRPPEIPPRWEWLPERVDADSDLGWFDYVMARSALTLPGFRCLVRSGDWSLWAR